MEGGKIKKKEILKKYNIGEKVNYYQRRLKDNTLSSKKREFALSRIKTLQNLKTRYSVIMIPDKIIYNYYTGREKHFYVVINSNKKNIHVCSITHSKNMCKKYDHFLLDNFDGKSYLITYIRKNTKMNKPINLYRCYDVGSKNYKKYSLSDKDKKELDIKVPI